MFGLQLLCFLIFFNNQNKLWLDVILLDQAFVDKKKLALKKLQEAIDERKVDFGVLDFINAVNSYEQYYTTSSCAGRFVILTKGSFRGKYSSHFVYKTHTPPINLQKVIEALEKPFEGFCYLNLEPPTFHVACKTLEDAVTLHQLSIDSNIGYSMFKTIKKSIIVEIRGTGNLSIPIGFNGKIYVTNEYLEQVVNLSNEILVDEQLRMKNFENHLDQLAITKGK